MSSDMMREVSESLFEFLIEAFPSDRSYTRPDIEQDPMPPLIAHFLGQILQNKLDVEVEHLRSVRSTWFDYDHPDVQQAYTSFVASLGRHGQIPSEEWRGTLKRATKFVIAHLILPSHTLVEYVFRDEDGPLPAPVIYRQLNYFAAYPYLNEAVETFLKKRRLKEIDRTRFSSLLVQIDRHMTARYSSTDWLRLLRPLFDLMRRVPRTRNQGIPIDLLSVFFGDKDAYEIQGRLQIEKEVHRTATIDEDSLRRVIEGSVEPFVQRLESTPPPAPPASPPSPQAETRTPFRPVPSHGRSPDKEERKDTSATPPAAPASAPRDDPQQPRPLWEQFQKTTPPSTETSPASENGVPPSGQEEPDDKSVPLWMQFQKKKDAASPASSSASPLQGLAIENRQKDPAPGEPAGRASSPPPTLKDTLTLEQLEKQVLGAYGSSNRNMFIEHLFAGSRQAYEQLLRQLNGSANWAQASRIIAEKVFKKNHVDIYSRAAIVFTESVENQFR